MLPLGALAFVTQRIEQMTKNHKVGGSRPSSVTKTVKTEPQVKT